MAFRANAVADRVVQLRELLTRARTRTSPAMREPLDRWLVSSEALLFHLRDAGDQPPLLAILGGTGTGKSTLVNRLLDANLTATSFRRTYTSGPVAIAGRAGNVPEGWLGIEHVPVDPTDLPVRGRADALLIVTSEQPPLARLTLVDTPDLDGDQPLHHAQADRVFRWAQAVLFLVTPEKYQMTELLPYYRLAKRYALPSLFVMNKCEEPAVLDDYRKLLRQQAGAEVEAAVFAIPRDDAAYDPPPEANLESLRRAMESPGLPPKELRESGLSNRTGDLIDRLADQVLEPLRAERKEADRVLAALRAMETPPSGVDVNPLTQQLQRRMQQRSILYLMGPQRMLDRVRQVPQLLARLPRSAWDLMMKGSTTLGEPPTADGTAQAPDFRAMVVDQFTLVQSRIDDVLRSTPTGQRWIDASPAYAETRIAPDDAGRIADEELAALKAWLEQRWNAAPRDTAVIQKLLKHLPGGQKLTQWSEAAPYLLTVVLVANNAFFGPIDLLVIGGYSLATWISEKLSNEVASRTREANRRIEQRFTRLAHDQIRRTREWVEQQVPTESELGRIESLAHSIHDLVPQSVGGGV